MLSQPLAVIRDYDGLHQALRNRANSLNVSRETLEDIAGLGGCYISKVLSDRPAKIIGKISLGALLQAMGVKLVLVEDPEALEAIQSRLVSSRRKSASSAMLTDKPPAKHKRRPWNHGNSEWGRYAAAHAFLRMSESARRKRAKVAARARWAAVKVAKRVAKTAGLV